jgi:hypothetical protein
VSPVIELAKVPEAVPSVVLLSDMVGSVFVLQQIPLVVIVAPPLDVMVPPEVADVAVMALTIAVVRTGSDTATVVN